MSTPRFLYFPPQTWSKRYGETFFTARVGGFERVVEQSPACCRPREYAIFEIRCSAGDRTWMVRRRASDWFTLWAKVKGGIQNRPAGVGAAGEADTDAIAPPPKSLGRDLSDTFLRAREVQFGEFLAQLLVRYNTSTDVVLRRGIEDWLELHGGAK